MSSRLALLSTTHRVAPGLMSRAAWRTVESADRVASAAEHPLIPILAEEGIDVDTDLPASPVLLARALLDAASATPSSGHVVWLVGDDGDPALVEALTPEIATRAEAGAAIELEVLHGSYDVPGARLLDVVAVMDRLRSPGGCPWDAEQTHESLATYLVEETFETLAAIDADDPDALREELGDVLLQVAFHARIAEESSARPWSIDDVASELVDKLVRRHPHVFGDAQAESATDVERSWHELKQQEQPRRTVVEGVPLALPALALSEKLLSRTAKAGLDLEVEEPDLPDALDEELLGAILFGVVSAARRQGLDAESALRRFAHLFAEQARRAGMPSTGG
ncbi:MAG TPA: MazG family protein [Actinomycetes bacterium]|nr:MazG family protein [Actinomycetes bacterium]